MSCETSPFTSLDFIFLNLASYTICLKILFIISKQIASRLPVKPTGALTEGVLLKFCTRVYLSKSISCNNQIVEQLFLKKCILNNQRY